MKKSSKNYTKTKLVIFDINFDDKNLSQSSKQDEQFQKTVEAMIQASNKQNLVILTNNFLHDVINFCKQNKINSGWIIACHKTIIYNIKTKNYLLTSFLEDIDLNFIVHLALIYSANLLVYTVKNKFIYRNNLLVGENNFFKCGRTIVFKNVNTLKRKIESEKILNVFLKFPDGFKTSLMYLKIKNYCKACSKSYSFTVNKGFFLDVVDKSTIVFRKQITDFNLIWSIAKNCKVFATKNILYYPINHFSMQMYLQCKHHVINSSLYTPPSTEKKNIFCVNKEKNDLDPNFGATTNSFWKN